MPGRRLDPALYRLDAGQLAVALLGQRLVRRIGDERLSGVIVETEAYLGPHDLAAHTRRGLRSARNRSMWLGGGHAYVYFVYGMHHCFNVVAGDEGSGAAVLIRALRPIEGVELMRRHRRLSRRSTGRAARSEPRLADGPARLAQALAIDRAFDGEDLRESGRIWIEAGTTPAHHVATARVGVGYAGEWSELPLRFVDADAQRWVSRFPGTTGNRCRRG